MLLCLAQLLKATNQLFLSGGAQSKDIRFRLEQTAIAARQHLMDFCSVREFTGANRPMTFFYDAYVMAPCAGTEPLAT